MTNILIFLIIALTAISLWQLTKIFDLVQIGTSKEESQIADDNDNNLQGYIMFAFLAFIYIFTIYSLYRWGGLVLHTPASEHGSTIDLLMNISWVLIFIVQIVTQGLLHYFAFKYKGSKNRKATYVADNNKLEMIWSTIPAVVLAGLILYGLFAWTNIMFVNEKTEEVIVVEVYGQQFNWTARYSGKDNVLGKANVRLIEGVNTLGVDLSDKYAQDDFSAKEIHLPKGKKVLFKFRSQDVLHSAYFPHFRAQMNCVPGMVTQFAFTPTFTSDEYRNLPFMVEKVANINKIREQKSKELVAKGEEALDPYTFDYLLLCNKICGVSHYNMQIKVVIDTPADYQIWLDEQTSIIDAVNAAKPSEPSEDIDTKIDSATQSVEKTVALK